MVVLVAAVVPLTAGVAQKMWTNLACAAIAFLAFSDFIANYLKISAYFPGECMMIGVPRYICNSVCVAKTNFLLTCDKRAISAHQIEGASVYAINLYNAKCVSTLLYERVCAYTLIVILR